MALEGTGGWVWNQRLHHGESIEETVRRCVDLGFDYLLVRAWNGQRATDPRGFSFLDQYREYLDTAGDDVRVVPWTYAYGPAWHNDPRREAATFYEAVAETEPEAFVVDIEAEYKGQHEAAVALFEELSWRAGRDRVALVTFDLPAYHGGLGGLPYAGLRDFVGIAVPMVYWQRRSIRGGAAVLRSRDQWRAEGLDSPFRPAIQGHGTVTAREIVEAYEASPAGLSLWRYGVLSEDATRALRQLRELPRRKAVSVAGVDWQAAYASEHEEFMRELAAGADAVRLANRLAARLDRMPDDLAAELTRLNAHFVGRG